MCGVGEKNVIQCIFVLWIPLAHLCFYAFHICVSNVDFQNCVELITILFAFCARYIVGILAKDGVVIAADKAIISKLLDQEREKEKVYAVDDHIICAVAGWTADANILLNYARVSAQRYLNTFNEPQPVEELLHRICTIKQSYTQMGGLRPFGVSFLFAGWDKQHGFQLYYTDPAGNYASWKATAVGQNNQSAQAILRQVSEYQ